jgi:putative glutamine amidotransferase
VKIGLTYTGDEVKHNNYVNWLKADDDDIEVIKLHEKANNGKLLESCDALVLSGGVDIHPRFFNGSMDYPFKPVTGWEPERDEFEQAVFQSAIKNSLPVLGICRGLQLINVFYNGTLLLNIEEDNVYHKGGPDKRHVVEIDEASLLYEIAGVKKQEINSAHHQAIERLGAGIVGNSRSEDGIIEGIEWADKKDKPFMLGVQWHPERMKIFGLENSPLSKNIRDRFIKEIKLNIQKR